MREIQLSENFTVELEGQSYVWNGRAWFASRTYQAPPAALVSRLDEALRPILESEDSKVSDFESLLRIAQLARNASQYKRAEKAVRRAIALQPTSEPAFTILCSVLRKLKAYEQAVEETEQFRSTRYLPLLVSRSAALCDVGRWEEAKATIGRALAIGDSDEAFEVVHRIKANRPDLYESSRKR